MPRDELSNLEAVLNGQPADGQLPDLTNLSSAQLEHLEEQSRDLIGGDILYMYIMIILICLSNTYTIIL